MKKLLLALSIATATASAAGESDLSAPYTADPGPSAGNWEATLSGSGQSDYKFRDNGIGLTGSLGYFYTKNWLFSIKQGLSTTDVGNSNLINGRSVFQAAYQFDLGRWQPYVGMNIGAFYGAGIEDDASVGPELGMKYYVNESTFLYGNMSYEVPIDQCCKGGIIPYAAGVGFNF
ncbi:MAG: hypothetical protein ACI915_002745 [Gammaproteobacteria bacterium]|jgi:hypothetical protein